MSSKGRQIAKTIGKSIKKKFDVDFFQFPFGYEEQQKDLTFLPQGSPFIGARKVPKMQSSPRSPRKSNSLTTITATDAMDPTIVDHDEIIALTHDVKKFSDSLARLKALFTEGIDEEDDARVVIHESLGEVLSVLNPVMQRYAALQSPDIFTAARGLITMIKDHNYEDDVTSEDLQMFCEAIDQLALAFSSSVSEYLMGDMGPQVVMDFKTKSMNNIAGADEGLDESDTVPLCPEELDSLLVGLESGLSLALQRAKVWSKYLHDIISYMEKKAQLEYDYAKNLGRLAHSVQNSLKKEGFLPLQSVYCTALSHDEEFVGNLQSAQSFLSRFIEPLSSRRSEHDKMYKSVKEAWHRECRKMSDSVTNLRKSQALYHSRQQDHERARELALKAEGDKVEKKRKAEEESLHKTAEAETTYKACVAEANYRQQELFKVKGDLLAKIREQIELCDQVIRNVTVEYFHLYHSIVSPLPLQCQTLSESSKTYVPGSQYSEYVRRLPPTSHTVRPQTFVFEPYVHDLKPSPEDIRKESVHSNGSMSDHAHSPDGSPVSSPRRDKYRIPVKAWDQQGGHQGLHSDTDSASCSSKSHESSPSGSPQGAVRRHLITSQSLDELKEEDLMAAAAAAAAFNGKEKKRTKRSGGGRRENPTGIQGLMMHHRSRGSTTFGVDFQEQVDAFHTKVPPIVSKCLEEIENRGLMVKGIYRVSGVKSKVEHLCQRFDMDPESVSLEDVHPNIISNVLKLYLRQLPEPLLTFRLYPDFIHAAKDYMSGQLMGEDLIQCLHRLVKNLPSSNLRTSAVLMHHLQRVADHADLNQMSASNLGIVFGPTLLRPLEGSASLASLVDTPHQTCAIELLITHAHLIFGPSEDFQVAPSQTPIETLDQALSDVLLPGKSHAGEKAGLPVKTKSVTIESDDSSLSVFESGSPSSTPSSVTQPMPSEYVLPGSADFEQNDPALNGLDLDSMDVKSDEDDDLLEISLPDKSKPQADALSVPLSPQSISVTSGLKGVQQTMESSNMLTVGSSKMGVHKSASTPAVSCTASPSLPSSLSAPMAMADIKTGEITVDVDSATTTTTTGLPEIGSSIGVVPKKGRMHESHSTGDLLDDSGGGLDGHEGEKYTSDLLTGKKKPHSQKLENIKYLTRAPSMDEVTNIMDELIIKGGGISPLSSPGQTSATSPLSASSPMPSPKFFEPTSKTEDFDIKKVEKSPSPLPTVVTITAAPETVSTATSEAESQSQTVKQEEEEPVWVRQSVDTTKEFKASPSSFTQSSQCKVGSSRKSILEEIPIPTVHKPRRRHGTSDGGAADSDDDGDDDSVPPVTIPASPTIKRREIPSTTSKIPSSPGTTRSSTSSTSSSGVKAAAERFDDRAERFRKEQRRLVSAIKSNSSSRPSSCGDDSSGSVSGSVKDEAGSSSCSSRSEVLSGGCAMASQSVTSMEELAESLKETKLGAKITVVKTEKKSSKSLVTSSASRGPSKGLGSSPSSYATRPSSGTGMGKAADPSSPRGSGSGLLGKGSSGRGVLGSASSSGLPKKSGTTSFTLGAASSSPSSPTKASLGSKFGSSKAQITSASTTTSSSLTSSSSRRAVTSSSRTTNLSTSSVTRLSSTTSDDAGTSLPSSKSPPTISKGRQSTTQPARSSKSSTGDTEPSSSPSSSSTTTTTTTTASASTQLKSSVPGSSPVMTKTRLKHKSGEYPSVPPASTLLTSPSSSPSRPIRSVAAKKPGTSGPASSVPSTGSPRPAASSRTSPKTKSAHLLTASSSSSSSSLSSSPIPPEPLSQTSTEGSSPGKLSSDRTPRFV